MPNELPESSGQSDRRQVLNYATVEDRLVSSTAYFLKTTNHIHIYASHKQIRTLKHFISKPCNCRALFYITIEDIVIDNTDAELLHGCSLWSG
jgi:hypothetical protein